MMKRYTILAIQFIAYSYLLLGINIVCIAQNQLDAEVKLTNVMFYNVENLFDTFNDSITNDDEFLPRGERYWTQKKYLLKLQHISQVIFDISGYASPEIIGLCEVENAEVLHDLIYKTGLKNLNYDYIHYNSPDLRGIDVALLYRRDKVEIVKSERIAVKLGNNSRPTRDILHVQCNVGGMSNLHIFVNHWPSRYGGVGATVSKRKIASDTLSANINRLKHNKRNANIVVMGDFNDSPSDISIMNLCKKSDLKNLSKIKTLKYVQNWFSFDQFILSKNISKKAKQINPNLDYLLQTDKTHGGTKPSRTYIGYKYNGGYSDHLPILLQINTSQ